MSGTTIGEADAGDWYKGKPRLRTWEINENSTRYDIVSAGPSDEDLQKYWWSWAVIALVVGSCSLILFLSILSSRKARRNPFNLYLLYLAVPDFVFSLSCGVTCLLNAWNGEYWSAWMCNFQHWYCVFGIGANAWLNACVTRELYTMLQFSDRRKRYKSPSRWFVSIQALCVYLHAGFLGVWGIFGGTHWPFYSGSRSGLACLPVDVDKASTICFWLIFFPLFAGIPALYVAYVTYNIWRRKLLPPTGKRRLLVVYFGRLIFVFFIMWIPSLLIMFCLTSVVPMWAKYVGGLWSHLQGAVSVGVSLLKPDIFEAVRQFVTCRACCCCAGDNGSIPPEEQGQLRTRQRGDDWSSNRGYSSRSSSLHPIAAIRHSLPSWLLWGGATTDVEGSRLSLEGPPQDDASNNNIKSPASDRQLLAHQQQCEDDGSKMQQGTQQDLEEDALASPNRDTVLCRNSQGPMSSREFWPCRTIGASSVGPRMSSTASDSVLWNGEHVHSSMPSLDEESNPLGDGGHERHKT